MKNLLNEFWQRSSDACPLEAIEAEAQEKEWGVWYSGRTANQSFDDAVRPLIKWLAENHHPHTTIILTSTHAELVEGLKSTGPVLDYMQD